MNDSQINIRVQRLVVIVSIVLFALKILAYFMTNSLAVLTDALESTVNVVTGFIGLYSLRIATLPRDVNHPYGHGKAELLSASFEGIMILVAGIVIIYQSAANLLHPPVIRQLDYGILIISLTAGINYWLGAHCIKTGQKNLSIALISSGKHLQSDTWTTVGIVAGLLLIRVTGVLWIDSAAAILFGSLIMVEGYKIIRQTVAGIMDEADMGLLQQLIKVLNANKRDTWTDLHNLRIIKYGSVMHLDCHLTVPWYFNVNQAHAEVEILEALIGQHFPQSLEMFVHTDGCVPPAACRICALLECPERQHTFEERLEWTFDNITFNKRHG